METQAKEKQDAIEKAAEAEKKRQEEQANQLKQLAEKLSLQQQEFEEKQK